MPPDILTFCQCNCSSRRVCNYYLLGARLVTLVIVSCDRDVGQHNDDDLIHMGHAILTFYSALIDLLGRCAPEMHVSVLPIVAELVVGALLVLQSVTTPDVRACEKMSHISHKV